MQALLRHFLVRVPSVGTDTAYDNCNLESGNDNVAVKRLQVALDSCCNFHAGLAVDGIYGEGHQSRRRVSPGTVQRPGRRRIRADDRQCHVVARRCQQRQHLRPCPIYP